jgi:hypothetical protein
MAKKIKSSLPDETNRLITAAVDQGWRYDESSRGHVRLYSPDGRTIIGTSGTPSDHRAAKNFRSRLKRAGVRLDGLGAAGGVRWVPYAIGGAVLVALVLASRNKTVRAAGQRVVEKAQELAFGAGDPTERVLASLSSELRPIAQEFVTQARAAGYRVVLASGTRTVSEQNKLYAKGRTEPGNRVTNAKGGDSPHNFGLAFDFAFGNAVGRPTWPAGAPWAAAAAIGKRLGLEWGGDWKSFTDRPHLELPGWRDVRAEWKRSGATDYAVV